MFVKSKIVKPDVKESVANLGSFPTYRIAKDSDKTQIRVRSCLMSKQECRDSVQMFCDDASVQPDASFIAQPSYDDRFSATEKAVSYAKELQSKLVQ